MKIYLIGSLRNAQVPVLGNELRERTGHDIFDDWFSAGPEADDFWRDYERGKGNDLKGALAGHAARHVFSFDRHHLDDSDAAILLWPAGKSCHLEFGYIIGQGKPGFILIDGEPERYDVMLNFATGVFTDKGDLIETLRSLKDDVLRPKEVKRSEVGVQRSGPETPDNVQFPWYPTPHPLREVLNRVPRSSAS